VVPDTKQINWTEKIPVPLIGGSGMRKGNNPAATSVEKLRAARTDLIILPSAR
jgi:hypothetical protein